MGVSARTDLVTRSRRGDLLLFALIVGLMLLLGPRLRVYHATTVVAVRVERVAPDGRTVELPTPPHLSRPGNGYWRGATLVARLEPRIRAYMSGSEWGRNAEPGTRFVWTVRWSDDSTKLDDVERIVWEAPDGPTTR